MELEKTGSPKSEGLDQSGGPTDRHINIVIPAAMAKKWVEGSWMTSDVPVQYVLI